MKHRIYQDAELKPGESLSVSSNKSHHLLKVLRLDCGAKLSIFDGKGTELEAELIAIEKRQAIVRLKGPLAVQKESPLKLHLMQGLAKSQKMDWIIQKAVELGVASITPVWTERSQFKCDPKRLAKKQAHWQEIIIHACEQCGRASLPQLHQPIVLKEIMQGESMLSYLTDVQHLVCHPGGTALLSSLTVESPQEMVLWIGPEGGFSNSEVHQLTQTFNTAQALHLGPRVLRVETAAIAGLTVLQSHFGDMQ